MPSEVGGRYKSATNTTYTRCAFFVWILHIFYTSKLTNLYISMFIGEFKRSPSASSYIFGWLLEFKWKTRNVDIIRFIGNFIEDYLKLEFEWKRYNFKFFYTFFTQSSFRISLMYFLYLLHEVPWLHERNIEA